jgi:hypothetical protein
VLVAGAGTAHPVTHVRGPSSGLWRRGRLRRRLLPPPAKWGRWAPAGDTGVGNGEREADSLYARLFIIELSLSSS